MESTKRKEATHFVCPALFGAAKVIHQGIVMIVVQVMKGFLKHAFGLFCTHPLELKKNFSSMSKLSIRNILFAMSKTC